MVVAVVPVPPRPWVPYTRVLWFPRVGPVGSVYLQGFAPPSFRTLIRGALLPRIVHAPQLLRAFPGGSLRARLRERLFGSVMA